MERVRGSPTGASPPAGPSRREQDATAGAAPESRERPSRLRTWLSSKRSVSPLKHQTNVVPQRERQPPVPKQQSSALLGPPDEMLHQSMTSRETFQPKLVPKSVPEVDLSLAPEVEIVIDGDDIWNSAFRRACTKRTPAERAALGQTSDICEHFRNLESESDEHGKHSFFQKGVRIMSPVLEGLNFFLSVVDPISNIEPCASSAVAIVKMITTIGIIICGATEAMQEHIRTLLKHLPRIDLCDSIQTGRPAPLVQEALISVYNDLLDFFFHARALLRSKHFLVSLTKSNVQGQLSTIVSSFSQNAESLEKLLLVETNAISRQLLEEKIDDKVRHLLDTNRTKEIEYHNVLSNRANDACEWITSDQIFCAWVMITPSSEFIAMYGTMGSGKTITVAYILDYLRSHPAAIGMKRPLICSYYCKDDAETSNVRNVYRSILSQMLAAKALLRWRFNHWYEEKRGNTQIDPTQSIDDLRDLLVDLVTSLRQWLFLIIDAVDECDSDSRNHLLGFFGRLEAQASRVRVFVTSRHNKEIEDSLPERTKTIQLHSSGERDYRIARHLVKQYMNHVAEPVRDFLIFELGQKAQGCAIWTRMALEFLQRTRMTKEGSIKSSLKDMPSPPRLSELYMSLFEKMVNDIPENEWILARCLDILAAALRPLTLRELSCAVTIEKEGQGRISKLSDLVELQDPERISQLAKPFTSSVESQDTEGAHDPRLRLVHQSLKELIVRKSPLDWKGSSSARLNSSNASRVDELNGLALQLCVDYLLLEEFGERKLLHDAQEDQELSFDFFNSLEPEKPAEMVSFNPVDRRFGDFFTYAACYWTIHFQHAPRDCMPSLGDLIALSQPGSLRLRNWLDRMRRPDWGVDLEYSHVLFGYNPLALIVWFGPESALIDLLEFGLENAGLDSPEHRAAAVWTAVEHSISQEKFSNVAVFLSHPTTSSILKHVDLFASMSRKWGHLRLPKNPGWNSLLQKMVVALADVLVQDGNWALEEAARTGCLPLVKKLFDIAATKPPLKQKLLQQASTSTEYGPVGAAAFWQHVEVLQYLCVQDGIGVFFQQRDAFGDNILHYVARHGNPQVFRILVHFFPEGVNESFGGTTPLQTVVSHCPNIEVAKILLVDGKADVKLGDPFFMPLRSAVRGGLYEMCRVLIVLGGADPWTVVQISEAGQPCLTQRVDLPMPPLKLMATEREILKEICSLMPLDVPMDCLRPIAEFNQSQGG